MMTAKGHIAKWLGDIRFWIIVLALLRLYGITNPPLEVSHSWRQTTVAMAARNFYEVDANILYPRIDIGGDLTGITGMEFPLLNWLMYLLSLLFGFHDWYGRLINLLVTSVGCWYFYRLLKRLFGERHAFCATLILCASLWFAFARKIMPDTFSMSLVIMGLYYGTDYLLHERFRVGSLIGYALFTMTGVLSKLPSGYILVIFLLPLLDKAVPLCRKIGFTIVSVAMLLPVAWWYFLWVPHLVETYGLWHFFMGESLWQGITEVGQNLGRTLYRYYDNALKYIGFAVFVGGLVMAIVRRQRLLLRLLGLAFLAFLVIVFASGETFYKHDYYIVPFVPVMAMVAGYGVSLIENRWWSTTLLVAVALENILNHHSQFVIHENRQPLLALERTFDGFSNRDDRICINSGQDPTVMYYTHRKGWLATNDQLLDGAYRDNLRQHGCKYVLVMKHVFGSDVDLPLTRRIDNEDYTVYQIE